MDDIYHEGVMMAETMHVFALPPSLSMGPCLDPKKEETNQFLNEKPTPYVQDKEKTKEIHEEAVKVREQRDLADLANKRAAYEDKKNGPLGPLKDGVLEWTTVDCFDESFPDPFSEIELEDLKQFKDKPLHCDGNEKASMLPHKRPYRNNLQVLLEDYMSCVQQFGDPEENVFRSKKRRKAKCEAQ